MAFDVLMTGERNIRGMDTNSLFRMYDLARDVVQRADSQQERAKADRAVRRVLTELRKRNVPFAAGHSSAAAAASTATIPPSDRK